MSKPIRVATVYGSEEFFEYTCDPCSAAGEHKEAQGFCKDCKDYLCELCLKGHFRSRPSRHHTLLDKHKMPKLCAPCKSVGDKAEAAGYCKDCDDYLCEDCFKCHSKSRVSKHHVLTDKDNMPESTEKALASDINKMKINKDKPESQKYNEEYTHIRDINIKAKEDERGCFILSMTLVTSTEMLLADVNNKSLKRVNLEHNIIKDSLRLETEPLGLTKISKDQVAVVLENKSKIQIISVSGGLSVVRTLNTNGDCVDVKCIKEKLFVSFSNPVKFQILQPTGSVYKTISPDSEVRNHCTLPDYIAVSPDESMIYISDWKTNKVMCIDMEGRMISRYQGELQLDMPCDITISSLGSVYLCNRRHGDVCKMTSDLSEATTILGRADGLMYPAAMCFNADKQHLYISSGCDKATFCNFIKVYVWKKVGKSRFH